MATKINEQLVADLDAARYESLGRQPHYWVESPRSLMTSCEVGTPIFDTGAGIYKAIEAALSSCTKELILVTCFWAESASLNVIRAVLHTLATKADVPGGIRVRIYLSSASLLQKLFHTQSLDGYVWPRSTWSAKLKLPDELWMKNLDLQIKSIFVKPFSVMHPKFIIIDRKQVLLPSCNVSWEDWFEGCVSLRGPVVDCFIDFWQSFWAKEARKQSLLEEAVPGPHVSPDSAAVENNTPCVFLPSPHNINPKFRPLPWQQAAPPPKTPLNVFLLTCFKKAERSVYIQTPNLTSPPVLEALLNTLQRSVDIHIITSEKLMTLEQLVTAGTTTPRCLKKLIRRYKALGTSALYEPASLDGLMEEGRTGDRGRLRIEYYVPHTADGRSGRSAQSSDPLLTAEPVQSHLKLTIIDDELVILGSGNLDRASWYTSQELGIAFHSVDLATQINSQLKQLLQHRKKLVFDSG